MVAGHPGLSLAELWDLWRWGSGETLMTIGDEAFVRQVQSLQGRHGRGCVWCGHLDDLQDIDVRSNASDAVIFTGKACARCREHMGYGGASCGD